MRSWNRSRLEKVDEKKAVEYAKKMGMQVMKFEKVGKGWPDRIFLAQGGISFFIEFKRSVGGVLSVHQKHKISILHKLGFGVHVVDNIQDARVIIDGYVFEK